jgi:hypothetical protein
MEKKETEDSLAAGRLSGQRLGCLLYSDFFCAFVMKFWLFFFIPWRGEALSGTT